MTKGFDGWFLAAVGITSAWCYDHVSETAGLFLVGAFAGYLVHMLITEPHDPEEPTP